MISYISGGIIYNLFDSGLSNTLCVETLRHGTNHINNLSIRIFGGDPVLGGNSTGSTINWSKKLKCENYFYIFKDNDFRYNAYKCEKIDREKLTSIQKLCVFILEKEGTSKRILPRLHATLSGYNFVARILDKTNINPFLDNHNNLKSTIYFFGSFASLITSPTICFRFSKINPQQFEDDPHYFQAAYRTKQRVEPWRIGIVGSLIEGVNSNWLSRAKENPKKLATGIIQMLCGLLILQTLCSYGLIESPSLALAGALLI